MKLRVRQEPEGREEEGGGVERGGEGVVEGREEQRAAGGNSWSLGDNVAHSTCFADRDLIPRVENGPPNVPHA